MDKKELLINDIVNQKEQTAKFTAYGKLISGEDTVMHFACSKERLLFVIKEFFDNDLCGATPGGINTTIESWEWKIPEI